MSLNKEFKLYNVKVEPTFEDKENVIMFVTWGIEFAMGEYSNKAVIETLLTYDPNEVFVPVEDLTKQQILDWAIKAQGGDQFIAQLEYHHGLQLESERARKELLDAPLTFELDE